MKRSLFRAVSALALAGALAAPAFRYAAEALGQPRTLYVNYTLDF